MDVLDAFNDDRITSLALTELTARCPDATALIDSDLAAEACPRAGFRGGWSSGALNLAVTRLPDVDKLRPRMLGIDEHPFRFVRFFKDPATGAWKRFEP